MRDTFNNLTFKFNLLVTNSFKWILSSAVNNEKVYFWRAFANEMYSHLKQQIIAEKFVVQYCNTVAGTKTESEKLMVLSLPSEGSGRNAIQQFRKSIKVTERTPSVTSDPSCWEEKEANQPINHLIVNANRCFGFVLLLTCSYIWLYLQQAHQVLFFLRNIYFGEMKLTWFERQQTLRTLFGKYSQFPNMHYFILILYLDELWTIESYFEDRYFSLHPYYPSIFPKTTSCVRIRSFTDWYTA